MSEYTYKDIIIDPTSEEAKNAVGKKCFVSNIPTSCLEHANENDYDFLTKLNSINLNLENPFNVKFNGVEHNFNSIIVKKEEPKPKYMPFETLDEFIESYKKSEERITYSNTRDYIASCGMWLKDTDRDVYCLVTEIWNYGVVVGNSRINTIKDGDEYYTINEVTTWKKLLRDYCFIDGLPCGKLTEEGQ